MACYHSSSLYDADDRTRAIASALLYYDLFSFPLSAIELLRFVHKTEGNGHLLPGDLAPESPWWSSSEGYWFLRGREEIVRRRQALAHASRSKLALARHWAHWLQWLPGVRFVGITGSLAMQGASPQDDIDLLVIAAAGRLWLTRALVLAALWIMGVKRSDDGRTEHPNRACANVFLSEAVLALPDHNLFIAHEICQMIPLVGHQAYDRFLEANRWRLDYLPQWEPTPSHWEDRPALHLLQRALEVALGPLANWMERIVARGQWRRIRRKHAQGHNPHVIVTPTQLRFHPQDHSQEIIAAFEARWQALNPVAAPPIEASEAVGLTR